ncbi:MAG: M36 family metallopeptidase [Ferruginibacter sp.]
MKRLLLFFLSFSFVFTVAAQNNDNALVTELVSKNSEAIGLTKDALQNYLVSSSYFNKTAGTQMVYLLQRYKGLPVYNQMLVLAFKDGKLVSKAGAFLDNMDSRTSGQSPSPAITPGAAVLTALNEARVTDFGAVGMAVPLIAGRKYDFGKLNFARENVTAELMWVPVDPGKKETAVKLAWEIQVVPQQKDDYLNIRVDASRNSVLDKNNLTVYEMFEPANKNKNYERRPAAPIRTAKQAPVFNGSFWQKNGPGSPSLVNTVNYTVIPYPFESPTHGPATMVTNPWNLAGGNAVTLGWHNDGTSDYTVSRGNNVHAHEDRAANNSNNGTQATSTTSPDPLNFNFPPNYTVDPTTALFQQFAITNLFYWNNINHDMTYKYGFDEVSGNFQKSNMGRGGNGNDYVQADAQDGSGTNNANFSTPVDGSSGRMQMYLFNGVTTFTVNSPPAIAGTYTAVEGNMSTNNLLINVGPVTGQVIYYNDNAASTHDACVTPSNTLTGKIALINRGNCNFAVKVKNAQNAGAIAVIMVNNVPGAPIIMGGTDNTITIPAVMISDVDGATIAAQLANNVNVTLAAGPNLDGDLDNGVVSHEFFHGVSNRLTGGPNNTSCLSNAEEGGEGWSDYSALMLTTDWSTALPTDGVTKPRPMGIYVLGQPLSGAGIRNYKYCTDIAVNPLTYANMGVAPIGTEVHNIGEIWCMALWEMTWALIQTDGINANLFNNAGAGGNSVAYKLVMEGMKLQPCSPGYVDARNAILQADQNLYGGSHYCTIWTAFAKRGLGYSASQGSAFSATDQTAAYDLPPGPTISAQPTSQSACVGANVTFSVTTSGPNRTHQWQISTNGGGSWTNLTNTAPYSGVTTTSLLITNVSLGLSGNQYRCVVNGGCVAPTTVNSNAATLTIGTSAPVINTNPGNQSGCAGATVSFTISATSAISYQWQESTNGGGSWSNITNGGVYSGATTVTLTLTGITIGMNTYQYRCVATGGCTGTATANSNSAVLTVNPATSITGQPFSASVCAGGNTSFTVTATGNSLSYQWQESTNGGGSWNNISNGGVYSGATTVTLTLTGITAGMNSYQYRCVVSSACSPLNSNAAVLTVNTSASITGQPASTAVCAGNSVSFTVAATGSGLIYQWQESTNGGGSWNNLSNTAPYSGVNTNTLIINPAAVGMNTYQYRCVVGASCPSPVNSNPATLTVGAPVSITGQPGSQSLCAGGNVSFAVTVSGTVNSYQWQESTNGGGSWNNISNGGVYSGATTATLTLTGVTAGMNNYQYRCVVTGSCPSINSTAAVLTVNTAPGISSQPAASTICATQNTSFSVTATGTAVSYQWQVSTTGCGGTFNNISNGGVYGGATTSTLTITAAPTSMTGYAYRCVLTGTCPPVLNTNCVLLTVNTPVAVTTQPTDVTACAGSNVSFTTAASGTSPAYQWQESTNGGGTWNTISNGGIYSGANTVTLTLTGVLASMNSYQYRCVVNGVSPCGSLNTNAATLTVNTAPSVSSQPANSTICAASNTSFSVTAAGTALTYQWQVSTTGCAGSFSNIVNGGVYSGATTSTLTITGAPNTMNGYAYRCVLNGSCTPSLNTNCVTLTVNTAVSISNQPLSATVCAGSNTSFAVTATGTTPAYQWQESTNGGGTWNNISNGGVYSGATTNTLSLTGVTAGMNSYQYRCVVNGAAPCGSLNSNAATLTVNTAPAISANPTGTVTVCGGQNASYSVSATGTGLSYQWQLSTDGGTTWNNITNGGVYSGATTGTLSITGATVAMSNYRYRCIVSGTCTPAATSTAGILTVNTPISITANPAAAVICATGTTSFSASAAGTSPAYQWQVSTDAGATWNNVSNGGVYSNATTGTLTLTGVLISMNGYQYRCVVSGAAPCGSVNSAAAALTVSPQPAVTLSAAPYTRLWPGLSTTITASVNPPTGFTTTWTWSGGAITQSGNSYIVDVNHMGTYTVVATIGTCTSAPATISIGDSASSRLFVYPSPNDGRFTVSYYSPGASSSNKTTHRLVIYDGGGKRVYNVEYPVTQPYQLLSVNLKNEGAGTYNIVLFEANGNEIKTGRVVVR